MAFLPLEIPPGVVRPGTVYDARGRWYDAQLVRWHERAMQPIGGWERQIRTATEDVSAAISDDGGVQTDETSDANDATTDDVVLVPSSPAEDDALYIGWTFRFTEVEVNVSTAATDGAVTWEYWDGSAWTALSNVVDSTDSFQNSGTDSVVWDLPADWATTTVNSQGPFYYVRARVTTAGTSQALGEQIWIGTGPVDVDAPVRGMLAWRTNTNRVPYLALGTHEKLYSFSGGGLDDVTPSGFTTGGADAVLTGGNYGAGTYDEGAYGTGDEAQETLTEANTWQMDTWGEDLVVCAYSDGKLYLRDVSAGGVAAVVTNAPTSCVGVVVTAERFMVALGAGGESRKVQWSDQEDETVWTPAATNQAGSFPLPGNGQIMAGRRGRSETLIWTDVDLWAMRYIGGPLVYSFQQLGANCGAMSRRSMAVVDGRALWMGHRGFFLYDGFVKQLESDVGDYVFNDMNKTQASKVWAQVQSDFGEVTWFYVSNGSTEIDRYVTLDLQDGTWNIGQLERTAGVDRGALDTPVMADSNGVVYRHESGEEYLDTDEVTELSPYAESGPVELGQGDRVMMVRQIIPDEKTLGDVEATIYSAFYPTAAETTHGPFSLSNPTTMRLTGRQVRLKVDQVNPGWRVGTLRFDAVPGGLR